MALYPRRDFIDSRSGGDVGFQPSARRQQESLARRDSSRAAIAANGGRSAPHSAAETAASLTPKATWEGKGMFPNLPNGAPRIDAKASPGMNAVAGPIGARGPAQTSTPATMTPSAPITPVAGGLPGFDARAPIAQTPGLPKFTETPTGIVRDMGADHRFANNSTERAQLFATHPAIFQAGTPENAAYVAHAKQYGEKSAHDNIASILPQAGNQMAASNAPDQLISAYED